MRSIVMQSSIRLRLKCIEFYDPRKDQRTLLIICFSNFQQVESKFTPNPHPLPSSDHYNIAINLVNIFMIFCKKCQKLFLWLYIRFFQKMLKIKFTLKNQNLFYWNFRIKPKQYAEYFFNAHLNNFCLFEELLQFFPLMKITNQIQDPIENIYKY